MYKKVFHVKNKNEYHILLYFTILLSCGFIMGLFLSKYIDIKDSENMSSYLTILINDTNVKNYFISQFMIATISTFSIILLGTSLLGLPMISFLIYTKGLQIGFSCILFIYSYSFKGIVGILMIFLPQTLLDLVSFYMITHFCLIFSLNLVHSCTTNTIIPLKIRINKLLNVLIVCFILILASSYFKSTLGIQLIKLFEKL